MQFKVNLNRLLSNPFKIKLLFLYLLINFFFKISKKFIFYNYCNLDRLISPKIYLHINKNILIY